MVKVKVKNFQFRSILWALEGEQNYSMSVDCLVATVDCMLNNAVIFCKATSENGDALPASCDESSNVGK